MRTLASETKAAEERTAGFEEEIRETNELAEASEEMIRKEMDQTLVSKISGLRLLSTG